jgi:N-methylhydantoinase A
VLPAFAHSARGRLKPSATSIRPRKAPAPAEWREVWFGDGSPKAIETPFFDRGGLAPGHVIRGPAIVTQMDCTTVVPPGWRAQVDEFRNLLMTPTARR